MSQITIEGEIFECPDHPSLYVGATMTEGHVASLMQTRRENLRNNFAKKVKTAKENGGVTPEVHAAFAEYASKYEFGVRQPGAPRVTRDPVEKEAFKIMKSAVSSAYRAKYGLVIEKDELDAKVEELFEKHADRYLKLAKAAIREREKVMADLDTEV